MIFRRMRCWIDPRPRPGPEAMAVDEWLLASRPDLPLLRVYRWLGPWCSVGYFGGLAEARASVARAPRPGEDACGWVRRLTGGGVVDHRADWTYSLVVPKTEAASSWRGAESYREIHRALAEALRAEGVDCLLSSGMEIPGEALCFANPVDHDVVDAHGRKLAGAGQRRSRDGLLHQGSVALPVNGPASLRRAAALAGALASSVERVEIKPHGPAVTNLACERYAAPAWTGRR